MGDGRVPIPAALGGGSAAPLPSVDDALLRDAIAALLIDFAQLGSLLSRFVDGRALRDAPRAELEALGKALQRTQGYCGHAIDEARQLYAQLLEASKAAQE